MKVELIPITEAITGNKSLADALEKNFTALNEMAEEREGVILSAISEMKRALSRELNDKINDLGIKALKEDVNTLKIDTHNLRLEFKAMDKKLDAIFMHFGIDTNLLNG